MVLLRSGRGLKGWMMVRYLVGGKLLENFMIYSDLSMAIAVRVKVDM